jgi:hypothetical protein
MRRYLKGANGDVYFDRWQISLVYEPGEEEKPLQDFLMTGVEIVRNTE